MPSQANMPNSTIRRHNRCRCIVCLVYAFRSVGMAIEIYAANANDLGLQDIHSDTRSWLHLGRVDFGELRLTQTGKVLGSFENQNFPTAKGEEEVQARAGADEKFTIVMDGCFCIERYCTIK